ncbi:hypothetical protein ccbrp13_30500 [Ktedonobacteria bacterium brp13]|nr:hypothetical protein ccbrp13_30500 [Ktedonobacteria bacterium brp13]
MHAGALVKARCASLALRIDAQMRDLFAAFGKLMKGVKQERSAQSTVAPRPPNA